MPLAGKGITSLVANNRNFTSETPTHYDGTQTGSAHVTIFNVKPLSVPCCEKLPELKLFHELDQDELKKFKKSDEIDSKCSFCGSEPKRNQSGASVLSVHFHRAK